MPQRYVFALMCFFGLFNAFAMRGCLSIAITEMTIPLPQSGNIDDKTCTYDDQKVPTNSSSGIGSFQKYDWDEYTQVFF